MDIATLLMILALAFSVLALGTAVAAIVLRQTHPELAAVQRELHAMQADITDLADRLNHWMRRDNTRVARAAREQQLELPAPAASGDRKAALRARVAQMRGVQ